MPLIIVDIDGTCADIRPRLAKAGKEPTRDDPQKFQAWLDLIQNHETLAADLPVQGMVAAIRALADHCPLAYVTGRAEQYRKVTQDWLNRHHFPYAALIMRANTDWRTAAAYKEEAIARLCKLHETMQVIVIDDDGGGDCEQMYTKNGWTMLKVIL